MCFTCGLWHATCAMWHDNQTPIYAIKFHATLNDFARMIERHDAVASIASWWHCQHGSDPKRTNHFQPHPKQKFKYFHCSEKVCSRFRALACVLKCTSTCHTQTTRANKIKYYLKENISISHHLPVLPPHRIRQLVVIYSLLPHYFFLLGTTIRSLSRVRVVRFRKAILITIK